MISFSTSMAVSSCLARLEKVLDLQVQSRGCLEVVLGQGESLQPLLLNILALQEAYLVGSLKQEVLLYSKQYIKEVVLYIFIGGHKLNFNLVVEGQEYPDPRSRWIYMSGFGFIFFGFFPFMSQFRHLFFIVILLKCSSIFSRFPEEKSFVVYSLFLGCLSCLTLDVGVFLSRFNF